VRPRAPRRPTIADGRPQPIVDLAQVAEITVERHLDRERNQPSVGPDLSEPGDFGLWVGEATGALAALGHTAGLQRGSNVTLNLCDAAKNIAILAETGTGKTTRVINHLLVQALDFDCGGLIFDVRGDFQTRPAHTRRAAHGQDDSTHRRRATRSQPARRPYPQHRRRVP